MNIGAATSGAGASSEVAIAALATANDVARSEGKAAVKMLDESAPQNHDPAKGKHVNVRA